MTNNYMTLMTAVMTAVMTAQNQVNQQCDSHDSKNQYKSSCVRVCVHSLYFAVISVISVIEKGLVNKIMGLGYDSSYDSKPVFVFGAVIYGRGA